MVERKRDYKEIRNMLVSFLLRSGLAIVFLYAAISAFLNPLAWVGFIPNFVKNIIPALLFLKIHSAAEIILALWLLSNKKTFYAAVVSALAMLSIVIFNITALEIVFRDIAILFGALALAVLTYSKER